MFPAIPHVVLLTKIDQVCPYVSNDISQVFLSVDVLSAVDTISTILGVPRSHILPIKNYENEIELDSNVDLLALLAMRQILRNADSYFDEQFDLLNTEK